MHCKSCAMLIEESLKEAAASKMRQWIFRHQKQR